MTLNEAIKICQERIDLDRNLRDNQIVNDYDKFCENECLAIEVLIECCKSKTKKK